jgi:hypothetical protein
MVRPAKANVERRGEFRPELTSSAKRIKMVSTTKCFVESPAKMSSIVLWLFAEYLYDAIC